MRIAFDIGGTFTDFVLEDDRAGELRFHKVPTTPHDPATAALEGLATILRQAGAAPGEIAQILHATTVATNAILERKGAKTALITTRGFRDVLIIGRQKRYDTYDMYLSKAVPLLKRRDIFEIGERILADGTIERALDRGEAAALLERIAADGYQSIAVCLLHSYAEPAHEQALGAQIAERLPSAQVSLSAEISPKYREYERTSTVVANAYIKPIVARYVTRLANALKHQGVGSNLSIMQSNGGLVSPELACDVPVRIIESGPAAGVLLCGVIGKEEGFERVLTFDMGGTTAKLGAIDGGEPAITPTFEVDQVRYRKGSGLAINVPAVELLEIGAGGGSLATTSMGLIKVGPESAAADPGPVCYGRGGTRATLTDANLVLGYLNPDYFNAGAMRLDKAAAADAIKHQIGVALGLEEGEAAWGVHAMANANMERAMRIVSVERGRDPRRYALIAFGGAGPLHAARLALRLGIPKVIVPFGAGVGSAIGMLEANTKVDAALTRRLAVAPGAEAPIAEIYRTLEGRVRADMRRSGAVGDTTITRFAFMRYAGQGHEIRVDLPDLPGNAAQIAALARRFEAAYRAKYGYCQPGLLIEAVDWYAVGSLAHGRAGAHRARSWRQRARARERATRRAYFAELGGFQDCSVIDRAALEPGEIVRGPAIIEEAEATTLLPPHTTARVSAHGHLVLTVAEG